MNKKFCYTVYSGWNGPMPVWFSNFWDHCNQIAIENGWLVDTVMNYQLKPHGRLVKTKTQGWYMRWDDEQYHTFFVLRWS